MTTRNFTRTILAVERLEERQLMAGNVTASQQGHLLQITGDGAGNGVTLTCNLVAHTYQVSGVQADGAGTSINGKDPASSSNFAQFSGIRYIAVHLKGGDDMFEVGSPQAVDTVISQWLSIDAGDGNDKVVLGQGGGAAGGTNPVAMSLGVGTGVYVTLGAGNDELDIANAKIGRVLDISAGDGDDHVLFATEFTPTGATTPQVFPVTVAGGAGINLGSGADSLSLKNAGFAGGLLIQDNGTDAAQIDLSNIVVSKKLTIVTADGADHISLDSAAATDLAILTNGGADIVGVTNSRFKTMSLKLGADRDQLTIDNTITTTWTWLDGGADGSDLTLGSTNRLAKVKKQNIG